MGNNLSKCQRATCQNIWFLFVYSYPYPPHVNLNNLKSYLIKVTEIVQMYQNDYFFNVGAYNVSDIVLETTDNVNSSKAVCTTDVKGECLADSYNLLATTMCNHIIRISVRILLGFLKCI